MAEYLNKENLIKRILAREREYEQGLTKAAPTWNDAVGIVFGMPPVDVMTKEEWIDRLKAALEKSHGITEELRAYDGGSEAIADE